MIFYPINDDIYYIGKSLRILVPAAALKIICRLSVCNQGNFFILLFDHVIMYIVYEAGQDTLSEQVFG